MVVCLAMPQGLLPINANSFFDSVISIDDLAIFAILALIINFSVAALAYMFGKLFARDELVMFSKAEFFQGILATLLAFLVVMMLLLSGQVLKTLIETSNIGNVVPHICDPNTPEGREYLNYVYDVSPARFLYKENVRAARPSGLTNSLASTVTLVAFSIVNPTFGLIASIFNVADDWYVKKLYLTLDEYIDEPRPYGGLKDPVTGRPSPWPCHMASANLFLDTLVWNTMDYFREMQTIYEVFAVYGSVSFSIEAKNAASPYIGMSPTSYLEFSAESIKIVADLLGKIINVLRLVQSALFMSHLGLFPLSLSLGIVLRSFFMTRKLGGLLLSISVGLYLMLPLLLNFFFLVFTHVMSQQTDPLRGNRYYLSLDYLTYKGVRAPGSNIAKNPFFTNWVNPIGMLYMPALVASAALEVCTGDVFEKGITGAITKVFGFLGGKLLGFLEKYMPKLFSVVRKFVSSVVVFYIKIALFLIAVIMLLMGMLMMVYLMYQIYVVLPNLEPPLFMPGGITEVASIYVLYGGIFIFFAVLGAIIAVKNMSPLFGGDKDIAGLARII